MADVYDIPEDLKKEIINYCYDEMRKVDKKKMKENFVRPNVFMELLFDLALHNQASYDDYHLDMNDMKKAYTYARNLELILQEYFKNERYLYGIDDEDGRLLFYKQKNTQKINE